jgi:hypothetical protein
MIIWTPRYCCHMIIWTPRYCMLLKASTYPSEPWVCLVFNTFLYVLHIYIVVTKFEFWFKFYTQDRNLDSKFMIIWTLRYCCHMIIWTPRYWMLLKASTYPSEPRVFFGMFNTFLYLLHIYIVVTKFEFGFKFYTQDRNLDSKFLIREFFSTCNTTHIACYWKLVYAHSEPRVWSSSSS